MPSLGVAVQGYDLSAPATMQSELPQKRQSDSSSVGRYTSAEA